MNGSRFIRSLTVAASLLLSISLIAACGSSDTDPGGTGSGSSESASSAEATTLVKKWETRPTSVGITEPVKNAIAGGKSIAYIHCGIPACDENFDHYQEAAKVLGWTVKKYQTDGSPESAVAAFQQVVADKPDGVITIGFPKSLYGKQLKELEAATIPVIARSVTDAAGDGLTLVYDDAEAFEPEGEILSAWITDDSNGKANTVYADLPAYDILESIHTSFERNYKQLCASCAIDTLDIPITSVGKDVPERIVAYLRAHPDVNYLVFAISDLNVGVPAALAQAGLADKVKIIVNKGDPQNYSYLASGQMDAIVGVHNDEVDWAVFDAFARIFNGESIAPNESAVFPFWLITEDNLPSADKTFPLVENYQDQFKKLWNK